MTLIILGVFIAGYIAIAFEHKLKINKAATALITGCLCWALYLGFAANTEEVIEKISHHLGELSQILFFLMGAMTIVELVDAHDGFDIITKKITTRSRKRLIILISVLSFFLSAVLDNLTTAIVMISLVRKLMEDKNDRLWFAGAIVIASNAGGAWSPIGDVTTTMLWIGGQISAGNIILRLFLPSLVCLMVPLMFLSFRMKGEVQPPDERENDLMNAAGNWQKNLVFYCGLGVLLMVPVLKTVLHIPPFLGILFGLGVLWAISELIHHEKDEQDRKNFTVAYALRKIDSASILFFLGILLAISALQTTGQLTLAANFLNKNLNDLNLIAITIGLFSAMVDNVPLVAATMGMYSLDQFPRDHYFWEFLAYTTGTGGSALIIGSAAGVAVMGIEKIDFIWYLKKISWLALSGFFAGAIVYMILN